MKHFFWLAFVLAACSSAPSTQEEPVVIAPVTSTIPETYSVSEAQVITSEGDNIEAYFSPDGARLIYRSEKRPSHVHPQIYEMDLSTKKERRITYQDGEVTCPAYHPTKNRIFYSSTTDEIKDVRFIEEKSSSLSNMVSTSHKPTGGALPPFEIYESGTDGTNIERITNSNGYDSEVSVHPSGNILIFSSIRSGDIDLYTLDLKTKAVKRVTQEPGADGGAFFSPKGHQIVWRHFDPKMEESQIWVAQQSGSEAVAITTKKAIHWAPYWHPSGEAIVFSSNRDESENFELYTVDPKGLCLKRLTYAPGNDTNPSFSPDGAKVVFTSNRSGRNQIYMMDYKPPESCAEELP